MPLILKVPGRALRERILDICRAWTVSGNEDLYRCFHEAGHVCAVYIQGGYSEFVEMDSAEAGAEARTRATRFQDQQKRSFVACGGLAAELALFESGRVRTAQGGRFGSEEDFLRTAINNAAQDMTRFFPGAAMGVWDESMRDGFKRFTKEAVVPELLAKFSGLEKLARQLSKYRRASRDEIERLIAA